ncbi:MAG: hypothetical protein NT025_06095, partial [bacterium]|nr:hypothetical protein [bacterium]
MRIKTTFFVLVSAAAVLLSLTGAYAGQASRAEMQEILSAPLSQTERDLKLLGWFEQQYAQGLPVSEAEKEQYLELEARYGDMRGRDNLDNHGGPDAFNYFYMDNVAPDTVSYSWIELRGDAGATWLPGSAFTWSVTADDGYSRQKLPIGFSFPFYGAVYDCVRVMCNGLLNFTTTSQSYSNACLPASSVNAPMIAVFWDDLHMLYGGRTDTVVIGYRNFGGYFVVEFDQIGFYDCPNAPLKFEAVLYPNGNVKLQYNSIPIPTACANSQSIGIQQAGAAGSAALNYVCNTTGIQPANGRAILFYRSAGVPNAVTNLTGNFVAPNVVLTWTDPAQDTYGNPITIDNVQVWLGPPVTGTLLATVNPGVQS